MFQYISLYRKNASGQHGKVIGFTILQFILAVFLPSAVIFGAMMLPLLLTMTDISDQAIGISTAIWMLFMIIVYILVMIFVIYPILIGILRYFASAYKGRDFSFGEAYKVFKKGNYSKLVKIALLVIVLNFVLSLIIGFIINILMTVVMIPLMPVGLMMEDPNAAMTGASVALIITAFVLMFIVMIIAYIPYIILYIYFAVVFMVYIDEPMIPTVDKLKVAWDVTFKSEASMLKLFFSNLIMYILMTAAIFIIFIGVGLIGAFLIDAPAMIGVLAIIGMVISIIIMMYIVYLSVGSIVAYYFVGRDSLDRMNEMRNNTAPLYNNETDDLQ